MRVLLLAVSLSFVTLLLPVSPAIACINDRVTVQTESEFRKHYEFKSGSQETGPESTSPHMPYTPGPVAWSGGFLVLAALGLVTINIRRHARR